MKTSLIGILGITCIPLCLSAGCPVTVELTQNFSTFAEFSYAQTLIQGVDFCPNFEVPYYLSISHQEDGSYLLTYYQLSKASTDVLSCAPDQVLWENTCYDHKTPISRTLTNDEVTQVMTVFSSIHYYMSAEPTIFCWSDICRFDTYTWDGQSVTAYSYCGVAPASYIDTYDRQELDSLVKSLAAAG